MLHILERLENPLEDFEEFMKSLEGCADCHSFSKFMDEMDFVGKYLKLGDLFPTGDKKLPVTEVEVVEDETLEEEDKKVAATEVTVKIVENDVKKKVEIVEEEFQKLSVKKKSEFEGLSYDELLNEKDFILNNLGNPKVLKLYDLQSIAATIAIIRKSSIDGKRNMRATYIDFIRKHWSNDLKRHTPLHTG